VFGQGHPADAGRDAQVVVLDPRRGARLAFERAGVEHDDGQTLGRTVDGCGEARRTGADDRDVVHRLIEAGLDGRSRGRSQGGDV
jgi:hypothetical protein